MVRAARAYAGECRRFAFAARRLYRANRKHDALCREKHDRRVAMLMTGGIMRMVIGNCAAAGIVMVMVVVCPALVMIPAAKLHVAGQRIGEMNVMLRVVDAVHQ